MKKLLPFIFILFFGLQIKAQMWCAPGATWHYRVYANMFPYYDGHIKLSVTNTVTLNNITCQNMVGNFYGKTMTPNSPTTTLSSYVNVQTYESNKVIYIYNSVDSIFDTIANFNANIGDKWLGIKYPNTSCSWPNTNYVRPTIMVVDTAHVTINNVWLRKLKLSSSYYSPSPTFTFTVIEKISGVDNFLFHYTHCIIDGPYYGTFVCYSDNNFPLYNPSSAICDYIPTGVGVYESSRYNSIFKLYPNPTNGVFNLELNEPANLKIYSVTGALVYERSYSESGNFQLDISQVPTGIYNLRTESSRGASNAKLIKN
ncbi:MAG: T9SS type A sorting domain-containing protein [Bacteroidia bacterium]|nr:T9SS type A sorting domain-containing protein [Bacteroidia bacterium]